MSDTEERITGTVTRITRERHFGFINPAGRPGVDVFFYKSACVDWDALEEGDLVTFIERMTPKGMRGLKVKKVSE